MILNSLTENNQSEDLKIVSVVTKDDYLILKLEEGKETKKLALSLDDYYDKRLKEGGYLSKEKYNELQAKETLILAYKGAIRRLGIRDYSEYKMRQTLKDKYHLSNKDLDYLIERLKKYDYLNDERFVSYRIDYLLNQSCSRRMIYKKLKDEGIDEKFVDKLYPAKDSEETNIRLKADRYLKSLKNKPLNAKKKSLLNKLVGDGFDLNLAKTTIESMDLKVSGDEEYQLLKKERDKAYRKYRSKAEGYELKSKMYAYLLNKGFAGDSINKVLNEENKNEED